MAARLGLRGRPRLENGVVYTVVIATWGAAFWFWTRYNAETTDVGLMVEGLAAAGASVAALFATIAALVMGLRR